MAATPETEVVAGIGNDYKYGFHDEENYVFKSERGLSAEVVAAISERKNEPDWMRKFRLKSLEYFMARPLPEWGGDLSQIDFDNIYYYIKPTAEQANTWEDLPPGVSIEMPLQAYFRINAENMGQFERTLIIVDEGAYVHYVEGCTAPIYTTDSLHSAVVEIIVKEGGRCRYTTIQNWSTNVYNLVTKRAVAYKDATMEWVDGNLGSKLTMKYPAIWLLGERAHGEVLSIAFANQGQHQDAGGN